MENKLLIDQKLIADFRIWLDLNLDCVTWRGEYKDIFEDFWNNFFKVPTSLAKIKNRFKYVYLKINVGPIYSWIDWLEKQFLCYLFTKKNLTLKEICISYDITPEILCPIIREFLLQKFPKLEAVFNKVFQISHIQDERLNISLNDLNLPEEINKGPCEDDVMTSLEVTLYKEWSQLVEDLKKEYFHRYEGLESIKKKNSRNRRWKYFKETFLLLLFAQLSILTLNYANKYYENYLVEKIKLFRPDFLWPDSRVSFRNSLTNIQNSIKKLNPFEINRKKITTKKFSEDDRYGTESELTTLDFSYQRLMDANFEKSLYEEDRKGGYRDDRYGKKKVYRVMINSIDLDRTRSKINEEMEKYSVKQAQDVRPGTYVPGGVYYNVLVPIESLKDFLKELSVVEDSKIYESKTRRPSPYGKAKVFIWIKGI